MTDRPTIFFDGECALCHGFVKFVINRDTAGVFQFAPLQGETIKALVPEQKRATFPDSIVLYAPPMDARIKSMAVVEILNRLPGWPKLAGTFFSIFPRMFADWVYDIVAKFRKKIFGTTNQMCPLVPDNLRGRILP